MNSEKIETEIKIIGITGVIGSGKSTVAKFIKEMDYPLISSDEVAKELMNSDEELIGEIKSNFGEDIFINNSLDSKKLSEFVFGENKDAKKNREILNSLVHPRVMDENMKRVEEYVLEDEHTIFIESALIFELGLDSGYDYIICVDAELEICLQRASERLGISKENIQSRMNAQFSAQEKKKLSDFVIDNSGSLQKTRQATEFILELLDSLPAKNFK
jgi:dephospho-CoA kinase